MQFRKLQWILKILQHLGSLKQIIYANLYVTRVS